MRSALVAALAASLLPAMCQASTIAYTFATTGSTTPQSGQNATYGFLFTPVVNITVDSLGFLDVDQDGLLGGHQVGIWDNGGTLLTSTTVTTANSTLDGAVVGNAQFRFTPITPLALTAGVQYRIGAFEGTLDRWLSPVTNLSNAPSLVTVGAGVFVVGSFGFPSQNIGNTYAITNFTVADSSVPEPSTVAMLGLAIGALMLSRVRKNS